MVEGMPNFRKATPTGQKPNTKPMKTKNTKSSKKILLPVPVASDVKKEKNMDKDFLDKKKTQTKRALQTLRYQSADKKQRTKKAVKILDSNNNYEEKKQLKLRDLMFKPLDVIVQTIEQTDDNRRKAQIMKAFVKGKKPKRVLEVTETTKDYVKGKMREMADLVKRRLDFETIKEEEKKGNELVEKEEKEELEEAEEDDDDEETNEALQEREMKDFIDGELKTKSASETIRKVTRLYGKQKAEEWRDLIERVFQEPDIVKSSISTHQTPQPSRMQQFSAETIYIGENGLRSEEVEEMRTMLFEKLGTKSGKMTLIKLKELFGEDEAEEMRDIIERIFPKRFKKRNDKKQVETKSVPLAFGKLLPKSLKRPKNEGWVWLYDSIMKSAVNEEQEEKYRKQMKSPSRRPHDRCFTEFTFQPRIPKQVKPKKPVQKTVKHIDPKTQEEVNVVEESKPNYHEFCFPKPPMKEKKLGPLNEEQKRAKREWLEKMYKPKKKPERPPIPQQQGSGRIYTKAEWEQHLIEISTPVRINRKTPPPPHVNPRSLYYEMTPRMMELAKPRELHPGYVKQYIEADDEDKRMARARAYVPTARILKMYKPRHVDTKFVDRPRDEDPDADVWKVKESALKYKATARIKKLAEPRVYPKEEYKDPFAVNPRALTYVATERMKKLAEPKGHK